MTRTVEAVYEGGVLPNEDAADLLRIIADVPKAG